LQSFFSTRANLQSWHFDRAEPDNVTVVAEALSRRTA
jgi:hypothetical protein